MADFDITSARAGEGAQILGRSIQVSVAVAAGNILTSQFAVASHTALLDSQAMYMVLNDAGAGEYVTLLMSGLVIVTFGSGSTFVQGQPVFLSANGKIKPFADIAASQFTTIIGTAKTTTSLQVNFDPTGIQA